MDSTLMEQKSLCTIVSRDNADLKKLVRYQKTQINIQANALQMNYRAKYKAQVKRAMAKVRRAFKMANVKRCDNIPLWELKITDVMSLNTETCTTLYSTNLVEIVR